MGISVSHSPSAAIVGHAGLIAGQGQHRKYQDQLALQQKSLAQTKDLSLLDASMRQFGQYLGIAADERAQGANLANSQWQTQAGIAGNSFLQQQQQNANLLMQLMGAGNQAALQTQGLQADALQNYSNQLFQNNQQQNSIQAQQLSQQYGAGVNAAMQGQQIGADLLGQHIGIAAQQQQQANQIFASGMQQQTGIAAEDRQQGRSLDAQRQNLIDQLAQEQWRTQYTGAIDENQFGASMQQQQYTQAKSIEAERQLQDQRLQQTMQSQLTQIEAQKALQIQEQQFNAQLANQDAATQMIALQTQMQERRETLAAQAYMQQQQQAAQQMASERMAMFDFGASQVRGAQNQQYALQQGAQQGNYAIYRDNMAREFEGQMNDRKYDTLNQQYAEGAEMRRQQEMSQLIENRAHVDRSVANGMMDPQEAAMWYQEIEKNMSAVQSSRPQKAQRTPQEMVNDYLVKLDNGYTAYAPPGQQPQFLKPDKPEKEEGPKFSDIASVARDIMNRSIDSAMPISPQDAMQQAMLMYGSFSGNNPNPTIPGSTSDRQAQQNSTYESLIKANPMDARLRESVATITAIQNKYPGNTPVPLADEALYKESREYVESRRLGNRSNPAQAPTSRPVTAAAPGSGQYQRSFWENVFDVGPQSTPPPADTYNPWGYAPVGSTGRGDPIRPIQSGVPR